VPSESTWRLVEPIAFTVTPLSSPSVYDSDIGISSSPGTHSITNWPGSAARGYAKRRVTVEGVSTTFSRTGTTVRTRRS
jgi:hypothetical protein